MGASVLGHRAHVSLPAHRAAAAAASRWAVRTSGDGMGLYKALCYCSVVNING